MSETGPSNESARDDPAGQQGGLSFDQRVQHFAAGYENAQAVVRFLDTKASAVIGSVPLILALLSGLFAWLEDHRDNQSILDCAGAIVSVALWSVIAVAVVWLLVESVLAVFSAFRAINPQKPHESRPSLLFPYADDPTSGNVEGHDSNYDARLAYFVDGVCQADVLEDYRRQHSRMAEIIARKIEHLSVAVSSVKRLFLAAFILAVLIACMHA